MKRIYISIAIALSCSAAQAFKIDRVIVATDANPTYIHFWPLVARAWQKKLGIKPTLALIADKDIIVDETVGDVIRFEPIPGVPTSVYAQAIRILLPALFEHEVSLTSDIDMLPLSNDYFTKAVQHVPDHCFVTYMDKAYPVWHQAFPICYNAARGSTVQEIFNVHTKADIEKTITAWHKLGIGWQTDELMLYKHLTNWPERKKRFIKLGDNTGTRRVDRSNWSYDKKLLQQNYYIDAHCLRPYHQHKGQIDQLMRDAGL